MRIYWTMLAALALLVAPPSASAGPKLRFEANPGGELRGQILKD